MFSKNGRGRAARGQGLIARIELFPALSASCELVGELKRRSILSANLARSRDNPRFSALAGGAGKGLACHAGLPSSLNESTYTLSGLRQTLTYKRMPSKGVTNS